MIITKIKVSNGYRVEINSTVKGYRLSTDAYIHRVGNQWCFWDDTFPKLKDAIKVLRMNHETKVMYYKAASWKCGDQSFDNFGEAIEYALIHGISVYSISLCKPV